MLVRHARVESATFLSSFRGGGGVFCADPCGWLLQGKNKIRKKKKNNSKKYRPDMKHISAYREACANIELMRRRPHPPQGVVAT